MKLINYSLVALITALAILMPAASPVMADQDEASKPQVQSAAALMIKAPNIIEASQPLTITVFSKLGHETIAGAYVYALKASNLVVTADNTNYTTLMSEYEATAEARGALIGTTGADGTVTGTLSETGRFMLVATKDGFIPGFARLTVTLAVKKALNIKTRGSVEINKPVTISVTERFKLQAVEGTAVYAMLVTENNTLRVNALSTVPMLKVPAQANIQTQAKVWGDTHGLTQVKTAKVESRVLPGWPGQAVKPFWMSENATVIRSNPWDETFSANYAAEIQSGGFLLGNTDVNGQLTYTFTQKGTYVLVAVKEGYIPGFGRIFVYTPNQGNLLIKSPGSADTGASVTFIVVDWKSGQGIGGASLWALRIDDIKGTAESVWQGLQAGSAGSDVAEKYKGWAKDKGILLGTSADSGEVTYAFKDQGRYLLTAVKDGYTPGFSQIKIGSTAQKILLLKAPVSALSGQSVTIKVTDSKTGQPVENATVNAFINKIGVVPKLKPSPAPTENSTATQILIDSSKASTVTSTTDANGEVQFTFSNPGQYILVAIKDGYLSGSAKINITDSQSGKALVINAAYSGQSVTIKVWEKSSIQPVSGAAVYVLRIGDAGSIKPTLTFTRNASGQEETARAREKGTLAGYTDDSGQLVYNLSSSGQYLLAVFKDGYNAAFTYINYILPASLNSLYIKSQGEATVGDIVTILTVDDNGKAVAKAALYLVRMDTLSNAAAILQAVPSADVALRQKYGALLKEKSSFQGYTDDNGSISIKFSNSGVFMLLAVKDGYLPDFVKIVIKAHVTSQPNTSNKAQ